MVSTVTPNVIRGLSGGRPYRVEIRARQNGLRRFVYVYPVGSGKSEQLGAPTTDLARFSVVCLEAAPEVMEMGQHGRDTCSDYEVVYAEGLESLETAILRLTGGPVTLVECVADKIVIRPEPGNWRIENNGRLIASAGSQDAAFSFVFAAGQHSYEFHGIVPSIQIVDGEREETLPWSPRHEFLDTMDNGQSDD